MTALHIAKLGIPTVTNQNAGSNLEPSIAPEKDPMHDTHAMAEQGRTHQLCRLLKVPYQRSTMISQ
ncbi:hypothetical protein [Ferrimonas marina]|uniref:Uncharacterized protein n=1 Tax=Ferrimonas marina TaxID=299255 RepID=A0A1M5VSW3_9GAMM|nr:hypothetical protein [Ferrimonas marina]SHH78278.1 hypothetical protein SAMN02745129_2964 [Ferrimonas marina]